METYTENGIYGKDIVYVLRTLSDFDVYEKIIKDRIKDCNPNFYSFKDDFKKYSNKLWAHSGKVYRLIAIEDNYAMQDWYWHAQNINNPDDIKYLLVNSSELDVGLLTQLDWKSIEEKPQDGENITCAYWYDFWHFVTGEYNAEKNEVKYERDSTNKDNLVDFDLFVCWKSVGFPPDCFLVK